MYGQDVYDNQHKRLQGYIQNEEIILQTNYVEQ